LFYSYLFNNFKISIILYFNPFYTYLNYYHIFTLLLHHYSSYYSLYFISFILFYNSINLSYLPIISIPNYFIIFNTPNILSHLYYIFLFSSILYLYILYSYINLLSIQLLWIHLTIHHTYLFHSTLPFNYFTWYHLYLFLLL
jgi:hypothetical protein